MKVFLAIGNSNIETQIEGIEEIEIVEREINLETVLNLMDFIEMDYLIINRLLDDEDAEQLFKIANKAQKKGIKIILLIEDITLEKKLISVLVAQEVNSYIKIENVTKEELINNIKNYPKEFNFNLLGTPEIKIVKQKEIIKEEIIKTSVVKQEVIVCYSADNAISSAEVGRNIADTISNKSNLKVLLVDFNTVTPCLDFILGVDKELKINNKYDRDKQTSLDALLTAIDRGVLDNEVFKELVVKDKRYKFDIITGLFDLVREEKTTKEHYLEIIKLAKDIYDAVIIIVNPYIKNCATFSSLQKATQIVAISDANYASVRNIKYTFSELASVLDKEKIKILINNISINSLDKSVLEEIFESYKILGYIPYDIKNDEAINKQKEYFKIANEDLKKHMYNIVTSLGYTLNKEKKQFNFLRRIK